MSREARVPGSGQGDQGEAGLAAEHLVDQRSEILERQLAVVGIETVLVVFGAEGGTVVEPLVFPEAVPGVPVTAPVVERRCPC